MIGLRVVWKLLFFFSSRRRHTRFDCDWSSDVCSSDLGSFFSYGDERLGQGRNNAKAYLDEHPEVAKEIEDKIYEALGVSRDLVAPIDNEIGRASCRERV